MNNEIFDMSKIYALSFHLPRFLLPLCTLFAHVSSKPQRGEQHERSTCANRADIVWPRCGQEARIAIVSWGDDGGGSCAVEECITVDENGNMIISNWFIIS